MWVYVYIMHMLCSFLHIWLPWRLIFSFSNLHTVDMFIFTKAIIVIALKLQIKCFVGIPQNIFQISVLPLIIFTLQSLMCGFIIIKMTAKLWNILNPTSAHPFIIPHNFHLTSITRQHLFYMQFHMTKNIFGEICIACIAEKWHHSKCTTT